MEETKPRKGIILSGGSGTRLYPLTKVVSKQLMPVYDKPMIYYPIANLMMAGIREILIITTPEEIHRFEQLLGDGSDWGIKFEYCVQPTPDGLAQAFLLAESFLDGAPAALVLGDNLFYGHDLSHTLRRASAQSSGATVFGYHVSDPSAYGVVEFDMRGNVLSIEEKTATSEVELRSAWALLFDNRVVEFAKNVQPSPRGELEITDVIEQYRQQDELKVELLGRGTAWLDTGTLDDLLDAALYIRAIEKRQGQKVNCPVEVAYRMGYICDDTIRSIAAGKMKSGYGKYLLKLLEIKPDFAA